jgi:AcrR family transcriptional regulator
MPGKKVAPDARREAIRLAAYDVAARQGLEALTLRAVATRANVSHGTVVFHFKRKRELVAGLLDQVLYATAVLRIPDVVSQIVRPSERMHALLRAEMDRLSADPRHFRLLLDYWTVGVRNAAVRRKIRVALQQYRDGFRDLADAVVSGEFKPFRRRGSRATDTQTATVEGVAAVSVSLIHGCALQAVIDPNDFDVEQHFSTAAQMFERLANEPLLARAATGS